MVAKCRAFIHFDPHQVQKQFTGVLCSVLKFGPGLRLPYFLPNLNPTIAIVEFAR